MLNLGHNHCCPNGASHSIPPPLTPLTRLAFVHLPTTSARPRQARFEEVARAAREFDKGSAQAAAVAAVCAGTDPDDLARRFTQPRPSRWRRRHRRCRPRSSSLGSSSASQWQHAAMVRRFRTLEISGEDRIEALHPSDTRSRLVRCRQSPVAKHKEVVKHK